MNLKVVNCPDMDLKPYIEKAASFFAEELIPNTRIRNNCYTVIVFNPEITEYGYAEIKGYNTLKKARDFIIEIHPGIGVRNIFETLAHEMVHVKQYVEGELDDTMTTWRGKKIKSDNIEYWYQPWEVEALGLEAGLLTKFAIKEVLWEVFEGFRNPAEPIGMTPIAWKNL
jgi:hypothetical protein